MSLLRRLGQLAVILVGAAQAVVALLAHHLSLDDSAQWGASRRLLLYAGVAFVGIGLWPEMSRSWPSVATARRRTSASVPAPSAGAAAPPSRSYALSVAHVHAAFAFLGLSVTGLWLELDRLGFGWQIGLVALFGLLSAWPSTELARPRPFRLGFPATGPTRGNILMGLLILLPTLAYTGLTFRQEFPFSGDHRAHLGIARHVLGFWSSPSSFALLLWAGVSVRLAKHRVRWWPLIVLLLLTLASVVGSAPRALARYPGAAYFVSLPFVQLAQLLDWTIPLNANRLSSFFSLPVYLFLLRPLIVRRWPDVAVLPMSAFLFFQKDVIYYLSTAYLEPWSVIFVLLSVEVLVADHMDHRVDRLWLPPLLCGFAALLKEQAILLLPWIVLASYLPHLWRAAPPASAPASPRGQVNWARVGEMLFSGTFSAVPFLVYYRFRALSIVSRQVDPIAWSEASSLERIHEWAHRLQAQFGGLGVLLWIGVGVGSLGYTLFGRRQDHGRLVVLLLLAGAVTQVVFFYVEAHSEYWTGYPRFHLQAWVAWGGALLLAGWALDRAGRRPAAIGFFALVLGLQLPALAGAFKLALGPDSARSYSEHYDAPVYFPIRALFRDADNQLASVTDVHVVTLIVSPWWKAYNAADFQYYPELSRRFRYVYHPAWSEERICACRADSEAILLLLWNPVGLNAENEPGMYSRQRSPSPAQQRVAQVCLATLGASCRSVWQEVSPSTGRVTAALGTGPRR